MLVLCLFPKEPPIEPSDKHVDFDASIVPFKLSQTFTVGEMVFEGKLAL